MALKYLDRAQETTASTGTGPIVLRGAVAGFRPFAVSASNTGGLSDGDQSYIVISDGTSLQWEVQLSTYTAATNSFSRGTPLASSNNGALINLAGNAGTLVFSDIPAAVAALIGTVQTVKDASAHMVTNASAVYFTSGATVSNLGGGTVGVSISGGGAQEWQAGTVTDLGANLSLTGGTLAATGGGGGSYVGSPTLGVTIVGSGPGTILSTGTIVQPSQTNVSTANGILLKGAGITTTADSGGAVQPAGAYLYGGDVYLTSTGAFYYGVIGGQVIFGSGTALNGGKIAGGAVVQLSGGFIDFSGTVAVGAGLYVRGGSVAGVNGNGGGVTLAAGSGAGASYRGGNVKLTVGRINDGTQYGGLFLDTGDSPTQYGQININQIGTVDPHTLGNLFEISAVGIGFVLGRSQG